MSKWSYVSPLLSIAWQVLQRDDVRAWMRRTGKPVQKRFDHASDRMGGAVDIAVERMLEAMKLQRRPSTMDRIKSGMTWAGAGAALAAGALVASQLEREQLQQWLDGAGERAGETAERVGDVATRSASRARGWAADELVDLLGRVGLQPIESTGSRALRAAGWVGAGTVIGAGAVALFWVLTREDEVAEEREEQHASTEDSNGAADGAKVGVSEHRAET